MQISRKIYPQKAKIKSFSRCRFAFISAICNSANLEEWRELMTRWFQFGTFCPIFRVHGQYPYREMFYVAPPEHPAYQAMLRYDQLRYRLMPYI
ncbi:MAG: hypothetical protein KBG83_00005, partial [Bacteroidetes bacterium]|nr:hypothetical protein [Bacteroidota bacterium]